MAKRRTKGVAGPGERFVDKELRNMLARGPDAIRSSVTVLERRLTDAKFKAKWPMYREKLAQLNHLLKLDLNPPSE